MDELEYIFTELKPEDRRRRWTERFLEEGMRRAEGVRYKAAQIMGFSIRGLRDILNKYPELKERYKFQEGRGERAYQQQKSSFLAKTPQYWLPSRREYIIKELRRIAQNCGVPEERI